MQSDNKFLCIKEIKNKFEHFMKYEKNFLINFSISYYHKMLTSKNEMNFSLKKLPNYTIYNNNNPQILLERKEFAKKYLFYKYDGYKFIYIDEFGISKSEHPGFGWSPRGCKLSTFHSVSKSINYSVICGFSDDFITNYQVFLGARSSDFSSFILKMIKENNLLGKKYIFILDNCKIHRSKLLLKVQKIANFIFLPPYSPMLNPIETLFSLLKRKIRKKFYQSIEQVISALKKIISEIKDEIYVSLVEHLYSTLDELI